MDTPDLLQTIEVLKAAKPLFESDVNAYGIAAISVVAAIGGALAGYLPNLWLARHHQKQQAKSTAYQIYAELKSTLTLTEHRGYEQGLTDIVEALKSHRILECDYTVQIPDDRFLVYKANLAHIGLLEPKLQSKIVMLYQMMESIAQDIKPGGFLNTPPGGLREYLEALELYTHSVTLAREVMASLEQLYPDLSDETSTIGVDTSKT